VVSKVKHLILIHQGFKRNDVNVNVYIKHLKDDFIILVEFEMVAHVMNNQLHLIFEMNNFFWNVTSRGLHYSYLVSKCHETRDVSHYALAIYIKIYLKAKEELWKFKYFTMKKYSLKKSSTRNQNPSRFHNFITSLKFQHNTS